MIILPSLKFVFLGGYVTYLFLLFFVFFLIHKLIR